MKFIVPPLFFLMLLLVLSCRTVPGSPEPFVQPLTRIPVESGAFAYFLIDINKARPVLELISIPGIKQKRAARILDRMNSMAGALYTEDSQRKFQLVAWGNINPSQSNIIFGMNRDWKKKRCISGHPYWYSKKDELSITLAKKQVFVMQSKTGSPIEPCTHSSGQELPQGINNFSAAPVALCWLEDPNSFLDKILGKMELPFKLPAEYIFFSVFSHEEKTAEAEEDNCYDLELRIQASGAVQARALAGIISMGRGLYNNFSPANADRPLADIFFANAPVQEDEYIIIKTNVMNASEIALLIASFIIF